MFKLSHLYHLFKPENNENQITSLDFVMGGTQYAPDFVKGVVLCSVVSSEVETSNTKTLHKIDDENLQIKEASYVRYTLQLDIYKQNGKNSLEIEVFSEALRLREWLHSYYVEDYLKQKNAEILQNFSIIQTTSELIENKLINRAFFDFAIVSKVEIVENDKSLKNIVLVGENINERN